MHTRRIVILLILSYSIVMSAQVDTLPGSKEPVTVSLIYTGKSLGALGVLRSQNEHELLTEQANTEHKKFRLVSHLCWRAPGLIVFMPTTEPKGNELSSILSKKDSSTIFTHQRALISQNVMLVQDPNRKSTDMLNMLLRNPRQGIDFPDLRETQVKFYLIKLGTDQAVILESPDAVWPDQEKLWTKGEINRIDLADSSRLYEFPFNLGEIAVRSNLIRQLKQSSTPYNTIIDLGQRKGHFEVPPGEQARINFTMMDLIGYQISLPYHFELSLDPDTLQSIKKAFPHLRFLATNILSRDSTLFYKHIIESYGKVRIGYLGLVDPTLQGDLAKNSLANFHFVPTVQSIQEEIKLLHKQKVDAVIILSNMDAIDNAVLSQEVTGIDVIIADLQNEWSRETIKQVLTLPPSVKNSWSLQPLVTQCFSNGLGVGSLKLKFAVDHHLDELTHEVSSVSDHIPPDTSLYSNLLSMDHRDAKPKGDLMFPAFMDIIARHPELKNHDWTTQQGRVSQQLWEEFIARLLRKAAPAEITILRKFPYFPHLIGKLHEAEVSEWLWTEEDIVLCDVKGSALLKIIANDVRHDLIFSGLFIPETPTSLLLSGGARSLSIDWYRANCSVMGRRIDPDAYYRIATTDIVFDGIRAADFRDSKRIRRTFKTDKTGNLITQETHKTLALRSFVLDDLKKIRKKNKSENKYLEAIADWLIPDPSYERLVTFAFDRPTLWTSYNRKYNTDGYGSVPESRITATDSWVIGASGLFKAMLDEQHYTLDMGLTLAYARQNAEITKNVQQVTESNDDIKLDLTYKYKSKGAFQPFVRSQYDTEFTPTINPTTLEKNLRQQALRGVIGFTRNAWHQWKKLELASVLEQDFGQHKAQLGLTGKAQATYPIGSNGVVYSLRNDATYFFKSGKDTNRDLALKYNMIHEVLVPLVDELALSVGADFLFFKGKVTESRDPGMSMLLRVGLTYDRLWKPRYQPLF